MFFKAMPLVAAAVLAMAPAAADAAETDSLRFAIPGASTISTTYTHIFRPWMDRINADARGSIKVEAFFNIATFQNAYDRVVNGVADIGYSGIGTLGGKFPGSNVAELPSDLNSSEIGSAALWKLYEKGLISGEFSDVRLLAIFVFPQNMLNASRPITSLDQFKGLRIATMSRGAAKIATRLGAAPLTAGPASLYTILQRHTADAAVTGWNGLVVFKIAEVTSHHIDLGLDSGGGVVLMNKAAYAKLPAGGKQAIDKNTGFDASRSIGAAWDKLYAAAKEKVRNMPGHTIVTLSDAEKARFDKDIAAPIREEWVKETANGAAILAAYEAEVAKLRPAK
jgi:TRAP-type transport system periplasmic protein